MIPGVVRCPPVGSCVDPAGALGMLHPAGNTSLFILPDTDTPRQEFLPLAEIRAENTVKLSYNCLGGIFLSHSGVTKVSYPTGLKIHQGVVGSAPH